MLSIAIMCDANGHHFSLSIWNQLLTLKKNKTKTKQKQIQNQKSLCHVLEGISSDNHWN